MVPAIAVKTMNPPKNDFKKHLLANPFLVDVCSEITIWGVSDSGSYHEAIARTAQKYRRSFRHPESRLKHFWFLAQNYCQIGSKTWRATYFWVETEYLIFETSRKPFSTISGSWPKTIARRTQKHGARVIFESGPNIWFLDRPEIVLTRFWCLAPNYCQNISKTWLASYF